MTKEEAIKELAKSFLEEFSNDPGGIGDWVAQGGHDIDALHAWAVELAKD